MLVFLIILTVYIIGMAVAAPIALGMLMSRGRCGGGSDGRYIFHSRDYCAEAHGRKCWQPIGALRDRTIADGAHALGMSFGWPAILASALLIKVAPRTSAETKRQMREQRQRIEDLAKDNADLMRQIGAL